MMVPVLAGLAVLVLGAIPLALMLRGDPQAVPVAVGASAASPTAGPATRACDYCTREISAAATRCPHCAGEFRYCPTDKRYVGLTSKQKFVGLMRGGHQTQYRCISCDRVLDGPRF